MPGERGCPPKLSFYVGGGERREQANINEEALISSMFSASLLSTRVAVCSFHPQPPRRLHASGFYQPGNPESQAQDGRVSVPVGRCLYQRECHCDVPPG